MKSFKGFSLIELIVVIAIVALLSAIAVPTYISYRYKASINSMIPIIDGWVQQSIVYAQSNGYFPNAQELGLPTTINANFADTSLLSNNLITVNTIFIADQSQQMMGASVPCGAVQSYRINTNANNVFPVLQLQVYVVHNSDGTIRTLYDYTAGPNQDLPDEFLNSWVNLQDFSNPQATVDTNALPAATCM